MEDFLIWKTLLSLVLSPTVFCTEILLFGAKKLNGYFFVCEASF